MAASRRKRHASLELYSCYFANVANEIGALGIRVEKPGDFKSALDQGLAQVDLSLLTWSQTLMQCARSGDLEGVYLTGQKTPKMKA